MESLSNFESIIVAFGALGLLLALRFTLKMPFKKPAASAAAKATKSDNSWWGALNKTREKFFGLASADLGALKDSLEEACVTSDLGVGNTADALASVDWSALGTKDATLRLDLAKRQIAATLAPWLESADSEKNPQHWISTPPSKPYVVWFVGVNGVGKTTSIAKLASELKGKGHTVLLAAGDTFRAAAGEQLEVWAKRLEVPCVKGQPGADSSAVLFDAIESAKAKNIDFVLCDSAGRLHNQNQLMEALAKNKRVMAKALPSAPHQVLLVLDANTGQNMINQAETFMSSVGVTGLILTKLDGTARGGAVVAVARKTQLPILRLGLGESAADFIPFKPKGFAEALLGLSENKAT